ncbi:unnamed protein product [Ectocarpus sp. 12 AP-2014]
MVGPVTSTSTGFGDTAAAADFDPRPPARAATVARSNKNARGGTEETLGGSSAGRRNSDGSSGSGGVRGGTAGGSAAFVAKAATVEGGGSGRPGAAAAKPPERQLAGDGRAARLGSNAAESERGMTSKPPKTAGCGCSIS